MPYPDDFQDILEPAYNSAEILLERLKNKEITPGEWFERMMNIIERAYILAAETGSGISPLTPEIQQMIDYQVLAQSGFLEEFRKDLESGEWDNRYPSRVKMYINSSYSGYSHGEIVKQVGKVLPLPAYPAEGTQCLSNCKCYWVVDTVDFDQGNFDAYWNLGTDDNCQTCEVRNTDWNPVRIRGGYLI